MIEDRSTIGKIEQRTNLPVREGLAFTTLVKNGLSDADLLTQSPGRVKLRIPHKLGQPLVLPWGILLRLSTIDRSETGPTRMLIIGKMK
jgi:hypothetical protein